MIWCGVKEAVRDVQYIRSAKQHYDKSIEIKRLDKRIEDIEAEIKELQEELGEIREERWELVEKRDRIEAKLLKLEGGEKIK